MIEMTEQHTDLLVRAATVIDALDDIDAIAEIGGPMDDLATVLEEITTAEAVREIASRGVDMTRVADTLAAESTLEWRIDWLTRRTGCTTATAERAALTDRDRFLRYALLDDRLDLLDALRTAARRSAETLTAALAPHPDTRVVVPDTIPSDWA